MKIKKDAGLTADSERGGELAQKELPEGRDIAHWVKKMLLKHKGPEFKFPRPP